MSEPRQQAIFPRFTPTKIYRATCDIILALMKLNKNGYLLTGGVIVIIFIIVFVMSKPSQSNSNLPNFPSLVPNTNTSNQISQPAATDAQTAEMEKTIASQLRNTTIVYGAASTQHPNAPAPVDFAKVLRDVQVVKDSSGGYEVTVNIYAIYSTPALNSVFIALYKNKIVNTDNFDMVNAVEYIQGPDKYGDGKTVDTEMAILQLAKEDAAKYNWNLDNASISLLFGDK